MRLGRHVAARRENRQTVVVNLINGIIRCTEHRGCPGARDFVLMNLRKAAVACATGIHWRHIRRYRRWPFLLARTVDHLTPDYVTRYIIARFFLRPRLLSWFQLGSVAAAIPGADRNWNSYCWSRWLVDRIRSRCCVRCISCNGLINQRRRGASRKPATVTGYKDWGTKP